MEILFQAKAKIERRGYDEICVIPVGFRPGMVSIPYEKERPVL